MVLLQNPPNLELHREKVWTAIYTHKHNQSLKPILYTMTMFFSLSLVSWLALEIFSCHCSSAVSSLYAWGNARREKEQEGEKGASSEESRAAKAKASKPLMPTSTILRLLAELVRSYVGIATLITSYNYTAGQSELIKEVSHISRCTTSVSGQRLNFSRHCFWRTEPVCAILSYKTLPGHYFSVFKVFFFFFNLSKHNSSCVIIVTLYMYRIAVCWHLFWTTCSHTPRTRRTRTPLPLRAFSWLASLQLAQALMPRRPWSTRSRLLWVERWAWQKAQRNTPGGSNCLVTILKSTFKPLRHRECT